MTCGYFASLDTEANIAFKERYRAHFGERAPTLNTFGQSTYEGLHFLAALLDRGLDADGAPRRLGEAPMAYRSARNAAYEGGGVIRTPIYLARAEGNAYRVITQL
jgi:hypothetical protein